MKTIAQEFDPAIPLDQIHEHPKNPRRGNDAAVAESIEHNGFFGAVLVQRSTGYCLAGNTRLRVARRNGEATLPGFWLDVDDAEAERILLADNRMSDLAFYDDRALVELLEGLHDSEAGLVGTGYTDDQLALMLDAQEDIIDDFDDDEDDADRESWVNVRLELSPDTLRLWNEHRAQHDTDDAALVAVL